MAALHFNALIRYKWILFHHDFPHNGGAVRSDFQEIDPFCEGGDVDNLFAALKKRCTAFLLSDFMDTGFEDALRVARNKHDVAAIQVVDRGECLVPDLGMLHIRDAETGRVSLVDTSASGFQSAYFQWWDRLFAAQQEIFRKSSTDHVRIFTDEDYIPALQHLFAHRR